MKKNFLFEGIDCLDCSKEVESAINKINGVKKAKINFFTQKITIETENDIDDTLINEIKKTGKKIESGFNIK